MPEPLVITAIDKRIATIALNDSAQRNAIGIDMFDALDTALKDIADRDDVSVLIVRGEGKVFCAGFDLTAVKQNPAIVADYLRRLRDVVRALRNMPQVVVGAVHGAALAGGCALASACDIVIASPTAMFGYPVHRIGVSPAVTIPTLQQAIGPGAARSLLLGGELIDGQTAYQRGLVHELADDDESVADAADEFAATLASHGPNALRVTKRWLNELDGSDQDDLYDAPVEGSVHLAGGQEATTLLRRFWETRGK